MLLLHGYILSLMLLTFLCAIGYLMGRQALRTEAVPRLFGRQMHRMFFISNAGWVLALMVLAFWGLQALPTVVPVRAVLWVFQMSVGMGGLFALTLVVSARDDRYAKACLMALLPVWAFYMFFLWQRQAVVSASWPLVDFQVFSSLPWWGDLGPLLPWILATLAALLILPGKAKLLAVALTGVPVGLAVFLGTYQAVLPGPGWQKPLEATWILILGLAQLLPSEEGGFGRFRPLALLRLFQTKLTFRLGSTFVLMVIVLLESLNAISVLSSQSELRVTRSEDLAEELRRVDGVLKSYLADSQKQLTDMREQSLWEKLRLDNASYIVRMLAASAGHFQALAVYETGGLQMGAYPLRHENTDLLDLTMVPLLQQLKATGQGVGTRVVDDKHYVFGTYLKDHNHVLLGMLSWGALKQRFAGLALRSDTIVVLENMKGESLLGPVSSNDESYLWKSTELPKMELRLSVGMKLTDAYHEFRKAQVSGLLVLLGGALFAFLVSLSISWGLSVKLRKLLVGMSIVRGGNLNYRIDVRGHDEVSSVATAFNDMARELKVAREQLVELERLKSVHLTTTTVNHEINSPLGTILMTAQMVKKLVQQNTGQAAVQPAALATVLQKIGPLSEILEREAKNIRDICNKLKDIKSVQTAEYMAGHEMLVIRDGAGLTLEERKKARPDA